MFAQAENRLHTIEPSSSLPSASTIRAPSRRPNKQLFSGPVMTCRTRAVDDLRAVGADLVVTDVAELRCRRTRLAWVSE